MPGISRVGQTRDLPRSEHHCWGQITPCLHAVVFGATKVTPSLVTVGSYAALAHLEEMRFGFILGLEPARRKWLLAFDAFASENVFCADIEIHLVSMSVPMGISTSSTERFIFAALLAPVHSTCRKRSTRGTGRSLLLRILNFCLLVLDMISMRTNLLRQKLAVVLVRSQADVNEFCRFVDGAHDAHLDTLLLRIGLINGENIYPQEEVEFVQPDLRKR
jgi:hypothetical protein